ncbi:MAG TPA: transporter substrate-binding domain-containing protein, partial [Kofleriaceae bacterium]|nr:transporter substrate-binding domain-containing protein [Kofleriaceae bacterium]
MTRLGLTVVVLACACSGGAPPGTLAAIKTNGVLSYGADLQGGEPYLYPDPNTPGHLVGFETEIMEAIGRRLGVRVEMVQTNWSNLVDSLNRGDFDIIFNGLEATGKLQDRVLISAPYFVYAETLAVRRDSKARYIFDLIGKPVGSLNQTYAWDILHSIKVEPRPYEGND